MGGCLRLALVVVYMRSRHCVGRCIVLVLYRAKLFSILFLLLLPAFFKATIVCRVGSVVVRCITWTKKSRYFVRVSR